MGYVFDAIRNPPDGDDANNALARQVFGDEPMPPASKEPVAGPPRAAAAPKVAPAPKAPMAPSTPPKPSTPSANAPQVRAEAQPGPAPTPNKPRNVVKAELDERLVVATAPSSGQTEAFRRLASRVLAAAKNQPAVHAVTSACRKDGKTLTCLNLSMVMGELADQRTVLIEGDLRAANIIRMCRVEQMPPGLFQLLAGECSIDDALVWPEGLNTPIIYAGTRGDDRAPSLLNSHRLPEVIAELRQRFDQIVIDTPPILDVADAGALCAVADQVLLVARMNQTDRDLVYEALNTVRSYNRNVAGLVLTDVKPHAMPYGRRYMYGYYGYGYGQTSSRKHRRGKSAPDFEQEPLDAAA